MLPDRVSNLGPLTYESGALPIALRGPAQEYCYIVCIPYAFLEEVALWHRNIVILYIFLYAFLEEVALWHRNIFILTWMYSWLFFWKRQLFGTGSTLTGKNLLIDEQIHSLTLLHSERPKLLVFWPL